MLNDLLGMFEHIKNLFSERKGFTSTSNIVLRDEMSEEVKNAILSCYCRFCQSLTYTSYRTIPHDIDEELWTHFLNKNFVSVRIMFRKNPTLFFSKQKPS